MDQKIRSSFIPKKSIITKGSTPKKHSSFNILTFVSTVAFVLSITASAGAFLYMDIIEGRIDQKGEELQNARQAIDIELIEEFKSLDKKLRTAEELFNRHVATTLFFDFLESSTLKNVQYDSFNYLLDSDGSININMQGVAKTFNSLTLQSDIFMESDIMLNPVFSNLTLDDSGGVLFNVKAKVDPNFVLYSNAFNEGESSESF